MSEPLYVPSLSRLFGRRKGRPLRIRKSRLIDELLPRLTIALPERTPLSPEIIFDAPACRSVVLEIGFGGGEHLAAQAKLNPGVVFIGCEPFLNGVASLLDHIDKDGLSNIRIYTNDARLLLDALPNKCLEKCFILFADPWPKKRHAERRFVGPENLQRLSRVLKKGALLRLASDHSELIEWTRHCVSENPDFVCVYDSPLPPTDWVTTRYQEKALRAQRKPIFMDYCRR